jgi:hypothetical protein
MHYPLEGGSPQHGSATAERAARREDIGDYPGQHDREMAETCLEELGPRDSEQYGRIDNAEYGTAPWPE